MELRICLQCQELVPTGQTRCGHCHGMVGLADTVALLGRTLGRYRLTRVIGAGGMGIVYAAEHTTLHRPVAVKLLLPGLDGQEFVARFLREARVLAALRHPHIVDVLDFDLTPGGVPYYAMELLDGCSLASLLARRLALSMAELAPLLRQVGAALEHAHREQVVHRDLKPDNIFLAREGGGVRAKLLDFGIAKRMGADASADPRLTGSGAILGTPMYLTPEQALAGPVDARTDQYALALIVAECLIGRPLREGMSLTEIVYRAQHFSIDPAALPDTLPEPVRAALVRATEPDPANRHASVAAFVAALDLRGEAEIDPALVAGPIASPAALAPTTPVSSRSLLADVVGHGSQPVPKTATPRQAGKAAFLRPLALAGVIALAALLLWRLRERADPGPETPPASAPLRETASLSAPGDAGRLLGVSSAGALLSTAGGVWLLPLDGASAASRRADPAGERIVGVGEQGEWWLLRGEHLYAVDPTGAGERELLAWPAGASGVHALRRDGRAIAWVESNAVHLAVADGPEPRVLAGLEAARVVELRLGRNTLLALLRDPLELRLLPLDDRAAGWSARSAVGRVHDLAWDEDAGLVAVCGFAPEVEVHAPGAVPPRRIAVSGACHAARWLPGARQLVVRDQDGLRLGDAGDTDLARLALPGSGDGARFAWSGGELVLGDPASASLRRYALGGPAPAAANPQGGAEIWDLLHSDGAQYVAHADGSLLRLADGKAQIQHVHEAGISDLAGAAGLLASASDDRTLAVWRMADLTVTWRARGHDFLVNQLWLAADGSALWSSSSDGSVKRWRWPELEVEETLDLRRLSDDPRLALHALWLDADQREALVGSWNHALLHLRRAKDSDWQAQRIGIDSKSGYRMLELAGLDAVLLLGTQPTRVYAWDRRAGRLLALPDFGLTLYALAAGSGQARALLAGEGALVEFELRRDASGAPQARWRVHLQSALGVIGAADADPAAKRWWLGGNDGRVRAFGFDAMPPEGETWIDLR